MPENNKENQKSAIALREEEILKMWKERDIFSKTLNKKSPKGDFVFYDGPPFATGMPHYGHILPGTMKDVLPRYKTMKGYRVSRRWGWDCHGLPVENLVEKELNLKNKREIESYGIEKFNTAAKQSVFKYRDHWKRIIPRLGRFVDMDNDYRTMDASYTESVWWSWKQLYKKGFVYESFKVMPYCPQCGTTLSNFEVNQGYKDITDISIFVKFRLKDQDNTFLIAWTTTPWTLPGNMALAINPDSVYVVVEKDGSRYILAKDLLKKVFKEEISIKDEILGNKIVGKSYEPLFDYYKNTEIAQNEKNWKVYGADFVTMDDGSGIVHIAPAFGEDDYNLSVKENLSVVHHVNDEGVFKKEVKDFAGLQVKPKDDHQKTDVEIIKNLAHRGLLFEKQKIIHSYPHCWRCDSPLLNFATSSWFIKVTKVKNRLIKLNNKVNWLPEEVGVGRFGKWLEGARDWAVSRSRFWGAPIPIWRSEDGSEIEVLGSYEDLKQKTNKGNTFFIARHGEGQHNVTNIISSKPNNQHHLTQKGIENAKKIAKNIKKSKIDFIYSSDFVRTKETASIVAKEIGFDENKITYDKRLREVNFGDLEGQDISKYHKMFPDYEVLFQNPIPNGESFNDIRKRVGEFIYEIDKNFENKNILIISHETPIWLMEGVLSGLKSSEIAKKRQEKSGNYVEFGSVKRIEFSYLPHNDDYELDVHRPYIDEVVYKSKSGKTMKRIPEIFDTWYDSGSMPFAQGHYPFDKNMKYPADFIAEGLDQTRGWFYTLLVLNSILFGKAPYKNVVVNGLVLAEDGRKMSKRLNNYPDMELTINKYGADSLRYFLISSTGVKAEDVKFSEKGLDEIVKKHIQRLDNVYSFYELYKSEDVINNDLKKIDSKNVLDQWIIYRLEEIAFTVSKHLESYEFDRASRPIAEFIDDLSTWYIRRSRDRFKSESLNDKKEALLTTRFVLREFAKVIAPFMPFVAEDIYMKTKAKEDPESVHLCSWPEVKERTVIKNKKYIDEMTEVRKVISLALELRLKHGIKVRQPLRSVTFKNQINQKYEEIIKDEINVKGLYIKGEQEDLVTLDVSIDNDLRIEGEMRELLRTLQDERKKNNLIPKDIAIAYLPDNQLYRDILSKHKKEIQSVASLEDIIFETSLEIPKIVKK